MGQQKSISCLYQYWLHVGDELCSTVPRGASLPYSSPSGPCGLLRRWFTVAAEGTELEDSAATDVLWQEVPRSVLPRAHARIIPMAPHNCRNPGIWEGEAGIVTNQECLSHRLSGCLAGRFAPNTASPLLLNRKIVSECM